MCCNDALSFDHLTNDEGLVSQIWRSPTELAARGLAERSVIGLVGAEMASVPGVADIATSVADGGWRLSPSSLKADCISPQLASALARNGNRSVTVEGVSWTRSEIRATARTARASGRAI